MQSGHLAVQAMLKARTWFGSQGRSRPHSLWVASDGAPASIHVHSKGALILKQFLSLERPQVGSKAGQALCRGLVHSVQGSFGVKWGHLAVQAMLKARPWFGSQDRSKPHSFWMASDGVPASILVHSKMASSEGTAFL